MEGCIRPVKVCPRTVGAGKEVRWEINPPHLSDTYSSRTETKLKGRQPLKLPPTVLLPRVQIVGDGARNGTKDDRGRRA